VCIRAAITGLGHEANAIQRGEMIPLRYTFLVICLACPLLAIGNCRWQGKLTLDHDAWIVDLGRTPLWSPPAVPNYSKFKDVFKDSAALPAEDSAGLAITRQADLESLLIEFFLYLWIVTVVFGLLYLAGQGARRDPIMHVVMTTGIGLTAALMTCIALWSTVGGWGPPFPITLAVAGLIGGIAGGLMCYRRAPTRPQ